MADLSVFRMWASYMRSYKFEFHGMLIVKSSGGYEWFNWSYLGGRFDPISERSLKLRYLSTPTCEPKSKFIKNLFFLSWL